MICCVIPSSSFVPSFNSIHDTLQEIWVIENSTSLTHKCPWDKDRPRLHPGPVKRVIVCETHCHMLTRRDTPFHTECVCHALSRVITQLLLVTASRHRHFLLSCGPTVTALDGKHVNCHTFNLIYSS